MCGHPFGKSCKLSLPFVLVVLCLFVILVIFHFGFEGGILFVPIPDHCVTGSTFHDVVYKLLTHRPWSFFIHFSPFDITWVEVSWTEMFLG